MNWGDLAVAACVGFLLHGMLRALLHPPTKIEISLPGDILGRMSRIEQRDIDVQREMADFRKREAALIIQREEFIKRLEDHRFVVAWLESMRET